MATIKVFDSEGVKELKCFDTLSDVSYIVSEDVDPNDVAEDTDDGF